MKILTVVGARPQFIKAATISRALRDFSDLTESILHTGQHYDANMSDVFFSEMDIPKPKYHLNVSGGQHGEMTGQMLAGIEKVLLEARPDVVLVYGDTNSTLAGALSAAKQHIPVAHVEAGLRSFNMKMPEEINRIVTDRLSTYLFCPTDTAIKNLKDEGFDNFDCEVFKTGDVMLDAATFYSKTSQQKSKILETIQKKDFVLTTIHRAENTNALDRLSAIFSSLRQIAEKTPVVMPLHPRTKKYLADHNISTSGLTMLDPVGYFDMIELLKASRLVMTDSGGLQKEAYFFDKPCLTLRDETEWTELVEVGQNFLVGADQEQILLAYKKATASHQIQWQKGLYGNGESAYSILNSLKKAF